MLLHALSLVTLIGLGAPPSGAPSPTPFDRHAALAAAGQRLALVVGVGEYADAGAWPRLPNAVADAGALARELESRYGYAVRSLVDPTLAAFKDALRELAAKAGEADDVVVFFAGHGHFDADDNAGYLVLADAAEDCGGRCYAFDNLKRSLYAIRARHVLIMVDACHAGTFDVRAALDSGELRGPAGPSPEALRQVVADYARYPSRLFLASVANAPASDGRRGAHSPFMAALLGELARPGSSGVVSLDRLFVALAEGAALPVVRPIAFGSVVPHHPNGTFLFIEDVPLCDVLRRVLASAASRFDDVRGEVSRRDPWATVATSAWMIPGTQRCDLWHWEASDSDQLRCELGPHDLTSGAARERELFEKLSACFPGEGVASERSSVHGDERHHELRLALPGHRALTTTSLCGRTCELSVIVE